MIKSGLFMNAGVMLPIGNADNGVGPCFELGIQFTLAKFKKNALGLKINWFSLSGEFKLFPICIVQ
jgi:hypothetical protein